MGDQCGHINRGFAKVLSIPTVLVSRSLKPSTNHIRFNVY